MKQRMSFEVLHPYRLQPVFPLALHGPALTCTGHTGSWDEACQCMEEESPSDQEQAGRSVHLAQMDMGTTGSLWDPGKLVTATNTRSDYRGCRWQAHSDGRKINEELNENWDCLSRKERN